MSLSGVTSHPLPVRRGVPQGSVLGPILFLHYINDLLRTWGLSVHPVLFADDSNFFTPVPQVEVAKVLGVHIDSAYHLQHTCPTWSECDRTHVG